jgi:hypothetical protein
MDDLDSEEAVAGTREAPVAYKRPTATGQTETALPPKVRKVTRKRGSDQAPLYGSRKVKVYPIAESELFQLAAISVFAVLCFSIASACFGFALDLHKDISITPDMADTTAAYWSGIRVILFTMSGVFSLAGVGLIIWRGLTVKAIKDSTDFSGSDG